MIDIPCLRCGKFDPECSCPPLPKEPDAPAPPPPPAAAPEKKKMREEVIKMRREKRGSGREVIVFEGFYGDVPLDVILKEFKTACGAGGTVKGRTIELQGDHREKAAAILLARGFRSVRAGG